MKDCITSIILGEDIIPRLSLPTIYRLKHRIEYAIYNTPYTKSRIFSEFVCNNDMDELDINIEEEHEFVKLGPAGKIIWLCRTNNFREGCCGKERHTYDAFWSQKENFNDVIVSKKMMNDHLPNQVDKILKRIYRERLNEYV